MSAVRSRSAVRVRAWPLRVVAALLLATIAGDLAADARCDEPDPLRAAPLVVAASRDAAEDTTREPCASVCVPDCFCCSRATPAGPVVMPADPNPTTATREAAPRSAVEGVRPVPYRPPLVLA